MRSVKTCGLCEYITNVDEDNRKIPNVMGGCFLDGHFITTDCKACKKFKKHEKKLLWLDDLRNPADFIDTEQYDVVWVKSYYYFVKYFEDEQTMPDVLWFDHDLGENDICEIAPDGYDCAKYLINWCEKTGTPMANEIYSQSNNPTGKERILGLLNNYKNFKANE